LSASNDANELVQQLTRAQGHDVRAPIRAQLQALGAEAVPALIRALEHDDCFTRWEAVNLLGELAAPITTERIVAFALAENEVHARWRSFWAVTRFDPLVTIPLLLAALAGDDEVRRWRAALILSMLRRYEAADVLLGGLRSCDSWVQWEALGAIKALALQGAERAVEPFLDRMHERGLRQEAVLALGAIGSPRAMARLRTLLDDEEPEVRWRAAMSLARHGASESARLLRARLRKERNADVRARMLEDLSRLEADHGRTKGGREKHAGSSRRQHHRRKNSARRSR
jgi:HEAT repeat protein